MRIRLGGERGAGRSVPPGTGDVRPLVPAGTDDLAAHYNLTVSLAADHGPFGRSLAEAADAHGLTLTVLQDGTVHEALRRLADGRLTVGFHLDYFALWHRPGGSLEVVFGNLQVVDLGDPLGVADPVADDVQGVLRGQLSVSQIAAQVVEQPRPRGHAGPPEDAQEFAAQVLGGVAIRPDNVGGALRGQLEGILEVGPQVGEERRQPVAGLRGPSRSPPRAASAGHSGTTASRS